MAGVAASLTEALPARGQNVPFTERVFSTTVDCNGPDTDGDGIPDDCDLCPTVPNFRKLYWTNFGVGRGDILRANIDGSEIEEVLSGLSLPVGVVIDPSAQKIYWTEEGSRSIRRANLDGSNPETLVTDGLVGPSDIALDLASGKMYWTDKSAYRISRANLDGSDVELLREPVRPSGMALDLTARKIYWVEGYHTSYVMRANLDGTEAEILVGPHESVPLGLTLDLLAQRVYWIAGSIGSDRPLRIWRAALDGGDPEVLVTESIGAAFDITLDPAEGKMYWVASGEIRRANLDGSNIQDVVNEGSTRSIGIALDIGVPDCQPNNLGDDCDIASGLSQDCDGNGIPDECQHEDDDGDGLLNDCDGCPDDADKFSPGVCGCGVPDIDSDSDTVFDCLDVCPEADDRFDRNGNGVPDCAEGVVIPVLADWGLAILGLLLLAAAKIRFGQRRASS